MMKVKSLFLIFTILLAIASLGLALPPKGDSPSKAPKVLTTPKASTPKDVPKDIPTPKDIPKGVPSNTTSATSADISPQQLLDAVPNSVLGDLSQKCQSTLLNIFTSPEFLKCIPVSSLVPLLPLLTDPSIVANFVADPAKNYSPLEKPLLQFATLFCPAPKCSDKGVAGAISALQDGCKDDLSKKNPLIVAIFDATVFYSPIKDITCFKFGKTFCWDETILTFISLPPSPFKITGNNEIDAVAVAEPSAVCTKCNKAIVNDFFNFIKKNDLAKQILAGFKVDDKVLALAQTGIAVKCGASFEDGKIPK